jgi:hypothetical protein
MNLGWFNLANKNISNFLFKLKNEKFDQLLLKNSILISQSNVF